MHARVIVLTRLSPKLTRMFDLSSLNVCRGTANVRRLIDETYGAITQESDLRALLVQTGKFLRSPLEAQGKQNGHLGCSEVVHRRFQHRNERRERHGRHKVLNMLKTLAEWSPRYVIARRWQKEGTRIGAGAD